MRKTLATVALCALIFGVSFAGAKVATVTNPMGADLNGGGYQIDNVAGVQMSGDETSIGANYVGTHEFLFSVNHGPLNDPIVEAMAGTLAPSADFGASTFKAGSLYLQHKADGTGALWFKAGPTAADWTLVAGSP